MRADDHGGDRGRPRGGVRSRRGALALSGLALTTLALGAPGLAGACPSPPAGVRAFLGEDSEAAVRAMLLEGVGGRFSGELARESEWRVGESARLTLRSAVGWVVPEVTLKVAPRRCEQGFALWVSEGELARAVRAREGRVLLLTGCAARAAACERFDAVRLQAALGETPFKGVAAQAEATGPLDGAQAARLGEAHHVAFVARLRLDEATHRPQVRRLEGFSEHYHYADARLEVWSTLDARLVVAHTAQKVKGGAYSPAEAAVEALEGALSQVRRAAAAGQQRAGGAEWAR